MNEMNMRAPSSLLKPLKRVLLLLGAYNISFQNTRMPCYFLKGMQKNIGLVYWG